MEFKDLIQVRRSIRKYADKAVDTEIIKEIIADTVQAPTWKNSETGRYYIANTPDAIERAAKGLAPFNQNSSQNAALIVTTFVSKVAGHTNGEPDNEAGDLWGAYDLGLQNAYLCLAASDRGLDTLIMGIRDEAVIREELQIPAEETIMAVLALGYRDGEPSVRVRKKFEEIVTML